MNDPTDPRAWVALAEDDLTMARSALRRRQPLWHMAAFHAQQCAEKYLKALLVHTRNPFPRTHDLRALHTLCAGAGIPLPVDRDGLDALTAHAVWARYPGEGPTPDEARDALAMARRVRRLARGALDRPTASAGS